MNIFFNINKQGHDQLIPFNQEYNSILLFNNGDYYYGNSIGESGRYFGYCFLADGIFSIEALTYDHNEGKVLFLDNPSIIESDINSEKKHHQVIVSSIVNIPENKDKLTFFHTYHIKYINNKILNKIYTKCIIYYPDSCENVSLQDLYSELLDHQDFEYYNVIKHKEIEEIQYIENKKLFISKHKKKKIVCLNFGISKILLDFLKNFFHLILIPADVDYHNIYLLKPDGIIISDGNLHYNAINPVVIKNIRSIIQSNIPLIGFGIGMTIIAKYFNYSICEEFSNVLHYSNIRTAFQNQNYVMLTSRLYPYQIKEEENVSIKPSLICIEDDSILGIRTANGNISAFNILPSSNIEMSIILEDFIINISKEKKYSIKWVINKN